MQTKYVDRLSITQMVSFGDNRICCWVLKSFFFKESEERE